MMSVLVFTHSHGVFLNRSDIAQFDQTIDQAISRMADNERTCSVFCGIGSNNSNTVSQVLRSFAGEGD